MSLSLSTFYFIYLALVGVFFIFSFFNLYHLLRFGTPPAVTLMVAVLYVAGALVLLGISWMFLKTIDWSGQINLIPPPSGFQPFN